jgi:hypothetical protein
VLVAVLVGFHVMTFLMIRIVFLPHLVALLAFLPLERLAPGAEATEARVRGAIAGTPP